MRITMIFTAGMLMLTAWSANAQFNQPPDWPCIQRFVEEVAPGIVWPGPDPYQYEENWRNLPQVSVLVKQLTGTDSSLDFQKLVSNFAANEPSDTKTKNLSLLFLGVWETLNDRRKSYMKKIIKFAEHQSDIADQLEDLLTQAENIPSETGPANKSEEVQELESRVYWHMRVFDQRERTMIHLCEQPILLETQLGEIARTIYNELD